MLRLLKGLKWTRLKRVQRHRAVRSMYAWLFLVPIAAKSLALVESPAQLNVFEYVLVLDLSLPFSWMAFYFAALSFVIGNIAFAMACPRIVQDNDSYATFRADAKGDSHLRAYGQELGLGVDIEERVQWAKPKQDGVADEPHDTPLQQAFWTVFNAADGHNILGIGVSGASYVIGLFLIAWVAVENLLAVVKLAW